MTLKRSEPHNTEEPVHLLFAGARGLPTTWSLQVVLGKKLGEKQSIHTTVHKMLLHTAHASELLAYGTALMP